MAPEAGPVGLTLRPAAPAEAPELDAIAIAAKRSWGYDDQVMGQWLDDLRCDPTRLDARPAQVALVSGAMVGYCQVATDRQPWELWGLWVHPDHMGMGVGHALLLWAMSLAQHAGQQHLSVDSDPHALGFYLRHGAVLVGAVPAPITGDPARTRPQLLLATDPGAPTVPRL